MSTVSEPRIGRASTAGNKLTVSKVLVYVILIIWALTCIFPVYWMLTFSLKNNAEIFGANVIGIPQEWVWDNYTQALTTTGNMGRYFLNSFTIAVATIVITLVASAMATYAMTRMVWKGRSHAEFLCRPDHPVFSLLAGHGHPDLYRFHGRYPL